jgi:hypothetical protein
MTRHAIRITRPALVILLAAAGYAAADPILPDWTAVTFDGGSADLTNPYFPHPVDLLSIYEGSDGEVFERVESLATNETKNILGVETRVVRDTEYEDGLLVEVADDWYAQDTDGTVWYFGEFVVNYTYNDDGDLIDTDNEGSWIADGVTNFPGVIMFDDPQIGDEYFQEFAPDIALDFAVINSLTDTVDIPFGSFTDVLNTSEGNLIDGPELAENKLYAPGIGLVLVQGLDDDGAVEFEIPLVDQYFIPAPGAAVFLVGAIGVIRRRPIR